ncbi:hypothetical protein Val02_57100 [Virgisporangium aliadipatigenens]|uniref:Nucleoside phosphorylase domain-containing protein n=1 Tax=Virgisporangium aliadipatigenens TaxID=741659 RepID=A0A8J3YNJ3_9ACTN|nr:hypothetical protein Val02_57100 [Virgisporangium aliadipatigenens]
MAALREELEAAKAAGTAITTGPGVVEWKSESIDDLPYLTGEYRTSGGRTLRVALARPDDMGGRETGTFTGRLAQALKPRAMVMPGVCAGNPHDTVLGDVVIASFAYEWDEGKQKLDGLAGSHAQNPMNRGWRRTAEDFNLESLPSHGEVDDAEAQLWVLEQLLRKVDPRWHPALDRFVGRQAWLSMVHRLEKAGLVDRLADGSLQLTPEGVTRVKRHRYDYPAGPAQLPFAVHVGPMASGSAVMADSTIWNTLTGLGVRKIMAVEMEGATIATIAHQRGIPWLVCKGVMDHASPEKDDRYKEFAARASAQVMWALLNQLDVPTAPAEDPSPSAPGRGNSNSSRAERSVPIARLTLILTILGAFFIQLVGNHLSNKSAELAMRDPAVDKTSPDATSSAPSLSYPRCLKGQIISTTISINGGIETPEGIQNPRSADLSVNLRQGVPTCHVVPDDVTVSWVGKGPTISLPRSCGGIDNGGNKLQGGSTLKRTIPFNENSCDIPRSGRYRLSIVILGEPAQSDAVSSNH